MEPLPASPAEHAAILLLIARLEREDDGTEFYRVALDGWRDQLRRVEDRLKHWKAYRSGSDQT